MGQQQQQHRYTECATVDLEKGEPEEEEGIIPLYLQCKRELLEQICKFSPMLQIWDGLLLDTTLTRTILVGTNNSLWDEMQQLKELLRAVIQEATRLAELLGPPMEVFTTERALREKFDLYRFKQLRLLRWVEKYGNPHLRLVLRREFSLPT